MKRPISAIGILAALIPIGCGSVSDQKLDADLTEHDGSTGGTDGAGAVDASQSCEPNTTTCISEVLVECDGDGHVAAETMCDFGCASNEGPCADLDPSNGLAADLDLTDGAPYITFDDVGPDTTINTDTGDVMHNGSPVTIPSAVRTQAGAPSIRVFRVRKLTVENDVVVTGSNALAFVSEGDVEISATIQVAGRWGQAGPGAIVAAHTCNGSNSTTVDYNGSYFRIPGAGGGAFGAVGGKGGNATRTYTSQGAAGGQVAGTVDLQPLRGGCRGGHVTSPSDAYYATEGGEGGGAIQISSRTSIVVTTSGIIDAGGGGATFGKTGAGGGSGGGILLEAIVVSVAGTLAANGGAGTCFNWDGENGRTGYGDDALLGAKGGDCNEANGISDGGIGGSLDNAAGAGGNASGSGVVVIGGGGGGGVGRIRVNTRDGTATTGLDSLITPAPNEGTLATR